MKNKILTLLALIFICIFGFSIKTDAATTSEDDIRYKIDQLSILINHDYLGMNNKNELIGFRLQNFQMNTNLYLNSVHIASDNLSNILSQIELVKNSDEYSDTEKTMRIEKLYHDADTALLELDRRTMSYLMEVKQSMPTITYAKYAQKFQDFYNSLDLSDIVVTPYSIKY